MFCPNCGAQIREGSKFCTSCGKSVAECEEFVDTSEEFMDAGEEFYEPDMQQKPKKQSKKPVGIILAVIGGVIFLAALIGAGCFAYHVIQEKAQAAAEEEEDRERERERKKKKKKEVEEAPADATAMEAAVEEVAATEVAAEETAYVLPDVFPLEFTFASGVGAWGTGLTVERDGSFSGSYHDSDMGDIGDGYPNGIVYYCEFEGKFGDIQKVNDTKYTMTLEDLTVTSDTEETIEGGIKYIPSGAYGMEGGEHFTFYMPEASTDEMSEDFLSWNAAFVTDTKPILDMYGLCNEEMQEGFFSRDGLPSKENGKSVDTSIHSYELIIEDVTWEEAFEDCLSRGGYLVHINSEEEFDAVTEQILEEGKEGYTFWLGSRRMPGKYEYYWLDENGDPMYEQVLNGEYSSVGLFHWLSNEPSFTGEDEDGAEVEEDCVSMFYRKADADKEYGSPFYWNDAPNDILQAASFMEGRIGYICEYE